MIRSLIDTSAGKLVIDCLTPGLVDIVLWSGLFYDFRQHLPLARLLSARGYRVALVNPPGFGGSRPSATLTMEACGDAMIEVARSIGVPKPWIGGTSWGGISAIHAALRQSESVMGIILINTPVGPGHRQGILRWVPALTCVPPWVFARIAGDTLIASSNAPRLRNLIAAALRASKPAEVKRMAEVVLHERPDLITRLPDLQTPALVVLGGQDKMYPASKLRRAWAGIDRVMLVELSDTGHSSALEEPEAIAAVICDFINREGNAHLHRS